MQRRLVHLLAFAVLTLLLASFLLFGVPHPQIPHVFYPPHDSPPPAADDAAAAELKHAPAPPETLPPADHGAAASPSPAAAPPLHVAVTETGGSHDEVIAALVHAFGSQPGAELDLYQLLPRFGIKDIMANFSLPRAVPTPKFPPTFMAAGHATVRPDVFVAGTCELDIVALEPQLSTLLHEAKTHLVCVVHHADRWGDAKLALEAKIKPWVAAGRVEFWTLSPHTALFLQRTGMKDWTLPDGVSPRIRYFVPVFPVALPAAAADAAELSFGLQGDYDPARRDYQAIFAKLGDFLAKPGAAAVKMHLLGHGNRPEVPAAVAPHVAFDEGLDYAEYYAILSRTFALLPAFASDEYLDRKASSSVPAALIAGTPLVATREVLSAYSYLGEEAVWLRAEGEGELDVAGRVLAMSAEERQRRKAAVRERCRSIMEGNVDRVGRWVKEALENLR